MNLCQWNPQFLNQDCSSAGEKNIHKPIAKLTLSSIGRERGSFCSLLTWTLHAKYLWLHDAPQCTRNGVALLGVSCESQRAWHIAQLCWISRQASLLQFMKPYDNKYEAVSYGSLFGWSKNQCSKREPYVQTFEIVLNSLSRIVLPFGDLPQVLKLLGRLVGTFQNFNLSLLTRTESLSHTGLIGSWLVKAGDWENQFDFNDIWILPISNIINHGHSFRNLEDIGWWEKTIDILNNFSSSRSPRNSLLELLIIDVL